jgi:DNA-binding response OmpR family regulator
MTARLQGLKVLVVEDDFLVAMLLEDMLESAGCVVSGPIPRLAEALDAARREACDAAVLDVNLAGERIYPVAEILARKNVPFVFVTGYGSAVLPSEYAERPRLCKPFKMAELLDTLSQLVQPAVPNGAGAA